MLIRVPLEGPLPEDRKIDLTAGDLSLLFAEAMRDDNQLSAMEEIEHSVVHSSVTRTQFMDVVTQEVCLWSPKLMAESCEALQPHDALVPGLHPNAVEPVSKRDSPIVFSVGNQPYLRHTDLVMVAILSPKPNPCEQEERTAGGLVRTVDCRNGIELRQKRQKLAAQSSSNPHSAGESIHVGMPGGTIQSTS